MIQTLRENNDLPIILGQCFCLHLFSCLYSLKVQACCPGYTPQLSELTISFVSLLVVNERKEGTMALYISIGHLKYLGWSRYRDANLVPTSHNGQ